MSNLKIFKNDEFGDVRTVTINNEPWFVAKDISDNLGYAQTSNMMKRIDEEDFKSSILDGMNMKSTLINESGIYSAILGSKLKSAKRFKHWVTSEVLAIWYERRFMKKKLKNVPYIVAVLFILWLVWSFLDMNATNYIGDNEDCSKYNAFLLLEKSCDKQNRQSKQMSQHEMKKGQLLRKKCDVVDQEDLDVLAHIIYGESGADWCADEMQLYVGSVVLNRVKSKDFPNTIREVVFQEGQYAPTWDGNYYLEPDSRAYNNAKYLLLHGSQLPEYVIGQAEYVYPGLKEYCQVQNMYFSYIPE